MTHTNFSTTLRRASERFTAGVGALALTACLLAVSDARASTAEAVPVGPSVTVRFESEALATVEGTAKVYRKLKSAARQVCGVDGGITTLAQRIATYKCYDETLAQAVRTVDRPQLSALHQSATAGRVS